MTLEIKIGSLSLPSPLLTGSGTFGHDATALQFLNPEDVGEGRHLVTLEIPGVRAVPWVSGVVVVGSES